MYFNLFQLYFFAKSFDSRDLRREALFLWMTCFLAALSRAEKASISDSAVLSLRACLAAFLIFSRVRRLATRRLIFCLAALMADLVLGIVNSKE